jgi:hypothetical protein
MKSKKNLYGLFAGLLAVMLFGCNSSPSSSVSGAGMDLDAAIREAAVQMEAKIPSGTMIALVSVASPSTAFSTQVLTRLESAIVSSGKLVVVDRANLDKVRAEQGFQLSGEVDDESAKSIGKLLGAGAIVTGSLADLGDVYSLTLKAINIETATVAVSYLADLAKSERVETLIASGGGAAPSPTSGGQPGRASAAAAAPPAPTYKIGDTGPAGGLIFYDKGSNSGGWQYLEAAPAGTEVKTFWSSENFSVDSILGVRAVGTGKSNTAFIMRQATSRGGGFDWAAEVCDALTIDGYDDWFLPSQDELHLMYGNLARRGLGEFKAEWYWSSTPYNSNYGGFFKFAVTESFLDGTQGDNSGAANSPFGRYERGQKYWVRACRQF